MKEKIKYNPIVKSFLVDLLLWLYFVGGIYYFFNKWSLIKFDYKIWLFSSICFCILQYIFLDSLGKKSFDLKKRKKRKWTKTIWGWEIVILLFLTFAIGWDIVEVNPVKFFLKFKNASGIASGLFNPNFKILLPMLTALAETIYLALLATVFAIPFAFFLSFTAARNLMPKTFWGNIIYVVVRTIATVVRSIEAIVWAIIFSVWVGIGPFAGMLALMFHSIAALTKLYSEQIENIDPGPVEAMKATGANTLQVWIYAVVPQIVSPFLAFTIYRWDINVRMATIVGFVGGGGIGLALRQQQQLLRWTNVGLIMWLIALIVWIMDMISARVREKLINI